MHPDGEQHHGAATATGQPHAGGGGGGGAVHVVYVEGNIGSGKSTLCKELAATCGGAGWPSIIVVEEPIDDFNAVDGLFEDMYRVPERWSFAFQLMVGMARSRAFHAGMRQAHSVARRTPGRDVVVVFERSFMSDQLFSESNLRSHELGVYERMVSRLYELETAVDAGQARSPAATITTIYLRSSPSACSQRIAQRGRAGEGLVTTAYLTDLHAAHEALFGRDDKAVIVDVDAVAGCGSNASPRATCDAVVGILRAKFV